MLGGVGVTREADARPLADQFEELAAIDGVDGWRLRINIGPQRDVHGDNHQLVDRRFLEHVSNEGTLALTYPALVLAVASRPRPVGAKVFDVVEHKKQGAAVLERVMGWAEHPLEGLARIARARRLEVEIMVAGDVPPRHADLADDAVLPGIERQVVEHDVAGRHAERGFGTD